MKRKILLIVSVIIIVSALFLGIRYLLFLDDKKADTESSVQENTADMESSVQENAADTESLAQKDTADTGGIKNTPVADTGIRVCIDPGHYKGANELFLDRGETYCEGEVTLQIAQKLQEILKERYGITAYLTRDTGSININGYTNDVLDSMYIHLRGEMAQNSDLFVSIHTNANNDQANGYDTCSQPIAINKPVIIVNMVARYDKTALEIGNHIGSYLTEAGRALGIITVGQFQSAENGNALPEWTDAYNDSLDVPGTVCVRTGADGDYYGVLRGAANVGVPGLIIEHGFHTVPEVRAQIESGYLVTKWAEADAKGIADGFGLLKDK